MAQRLSFDERARVEAMSAAGVSVATAARCLGRHRSTVHRELRRGRRGGAYDAEAAQAAASTANTASTGIHARRRNLTEASPAGLAHER